MAQDAISNGEKQLWLGQQKAALQGARLEFVEEL